MIEDFYDLAGNRVITLQGMNKSEAIDHLIASNIDSRTAVKHVEDSLQKHFCGGLPVDSAIQFLSAHGVNELDTRQYISSDLYDLAEFKYPSYYPVKSFQCWSHIEMDHMILSLVTDTTISLSYLSNLLTPQDQPTYPLKRIYHDALTQHNNRMTVACQIYILSIYFKDDEETMVEVLNYIFDKLEGKDLQEQFKNIIIREKNHLDFSMARKGCINFARQFTHDRENNYPNGNYYFRHLKPQQHIVPTVNVVVSPKSLALYNAIRSRKTNEVKQLLRLGANPNRFYGSRLLTFTFPYGEEKYCASTLLDIFSLLLEYGATIDVGFTHGSALATVIFNAINLDTNDICYRIYENILLMLMLCDGGRTHSYINDKMLAHPFTAKIAEGQRLVKQQQVFMRGLITPNQQNMIKYHLPDKVLLLPSVMHYRLNEDHITFVTMPLENALLHFKENLIRLFKNIRYWKDKVDVETLDRCFEEIITDIQGTAYIDLLYLDNNIIGYNIAQYVTCNYEDEDIVIHHIKLALIDESAAKYKGMGLFMSHFRSFLPMENGSNVKVITAFEAAAPAATLLLPGFDYYPKYSRLNQYMPLLTHTIYQNMQNRLIYDDLSHAWYVIDPLAIYNKSTHSSLWKNLTQLSADRLFKEIYKPGKSIVVMYEASKINYQKYQTKLQQFIEISCGSTKRIQAKL